VALTKVAPALFGTGNNITSVTVGGSANTISLTFDASGVITSATNNAVSVANTAITGNIISSQITSVANTQITGNIISSQITSVANTQITGTISVANTAITGNIISSQITPNPTLYGNVSVTGAIGVGGATPTSNGSGITFPSTQNASSNANTLDDYEEGTFTPTITASSGSMVMPNQQGVYTRVGKMVTCTFWVQWTSSTLSGSPCLMNNLPFVATGDSRPSPSIRGSGFASGTNVLGGWLPGGTTSIQIGYYVSGGTSDVAGSQIPGGGEYGGTIVYMTT